MQKFCFKPLFIVFLLLSIVGSLLYAEEEAADRPKLPQISDIRDTAKLAQARNLPILIMFGTQECPYCELLREDFLIPMIISGDYTDKVILREAHIAASQSMINFSGKKITTREFSRRYGVTLFPTMVLVDSTGKPLVKKIIGITTPSLFGGTLDSSIDKALALTREQNPSAQPD